jgi:hypothetical protein
MYCLAVWYNQELFTAFSSWQGTISGCSGLLVPVCRVKSRVSHGLYFLSVGYNPGLWSWPLVPGYRVQSRVGHVL